MAKSYHQLARGSHSEGSGDGYRRWNHRDQGGAPVVVGSERDLSAIYPEKFKPWHGAVPGGAAAEPAPARAPAYGLEPGRGGDGAEDLDSLTVAGLHELAAAEEIDLPPHAKKADVVEAIRRARAGG